MGADIYGAVFVSFAAENQDKLVELIRNYNSSEFGRVVLRPESKFALTAVYTKLDNDIPAWLPVRNEAGQPLTVEKSFLTVLSENFGVVIAFYSADDYFDYQHWENGRLVRFLDSTDEGWDTVYGTEDPWEEDSFFSAEALEKRIAELEDWGELSEEKRLEIEKVWQEKKIRNFAPEPRIEVDKKIRAIHNYYGLWPAFSRPENNIILYSKENYPQKFS
jgi:hypothetical protein